MPNINLSAQTAAGTFQVAAGYAIRDIFINNTTANAVTGGVKFGTTLGGTDVITAQAVGANGKVRVLDSDLSKSFFSTSAHQTIYFDAVTAWNSASLNLHIKLDRLNT